MQYVPIEAVLEMSAIFSGVIFALIAISAVYHYSNDSRFRRWAISMVLFWFAFLPTNIFMDFPFIGGFISSLFRVFGSVLVLRAFGFRPFRKLSNLQLHTGIFILLVLYWIPIVLFNLPITISATLCSILMAISFSFVGYEILTFPHNRSKVWLSSGVSYIIWAISSIPMTLLPFVPEVVIFGYTQFIGQCLVLVTMFLSYFSSITRRLERHLKINEITGSLISHDLRNYLNVTYGALDLVQPKNEESEGMLQVARETIIDASTFIKDVRTMLIEIGTYTTSMEDLDLIRLVDRAINRAKQEYKLDDSQLKCDISDSVFACTSPLMAEVIWNIIDNAVKHSTNNPEISIKIEDGDNPLISIADKSGGMSNQLKERLLGSDDSANGLGLGHLLIRDISKLCSVSLSISDREERDTIIGTIFLLEFPPAGGTP